MCAKKKHQKSTVAIGHAMETLACDYLIKQNLQLIKRNFRCRLGEIDLIMLDAATLVFVEVRYRSGHGYGSAAATITRSKQRKIIKTAQCYLASNRQHRNRSMRFDVISIDKFKTETQKSWQLDWIKNAFQVDCTI